jgi:hypothetical protein
MLADCNFYLLISRIKGIHEYSKIKMSAKIG